MTENNQEDIDRVRQYYDTQVQAEWERLELCVMEHAITSRLLKQHLPPSPARILDVGGGPGRYALDLCQRGYAVNLLDLSSENINFAQERALELGLIFENSMVFDAAHPLPYTDSSFDAVLMMGPLYHLVKPQDRQMALKEAFRVLKPGGLIFSAFITLFGALQSVVLYNTNGLENEWKTMQFGVNNYELGFTIAWFSRIEEIMDLMTAFKQIEIVGCEGFSSFLQDKYKGIDPALFEKWVDLNLEFGRAPHSAGASNHILYIGRKQND